MAAADADVADTAGNSDAGLIAAETATAAGGIAAGVKGVVC